MFLISVRRFTTSALAAALLACLVACASAVASPVIVVSGGGHATVRNDPALPPPAATALPRPPRVFTALAHASGGPTVTRVLTDAHISGAQRARYRGIYSRALSAVKRLRGYRRTELASVISSVRDIARRGRLSVSRMPNVFLELQRNTEWWPNHGAPHMPQQGVGLGGARVEFGADPVVFQWYPGEGLRIQQLATFGRANSLASGCQAKPSSCDRAGLRRALDRIVTLASNRGGFLAWEYLFAFDGGAPPWMSGMAQATAIQALVRGAAIFGDSRYLKVAGRALGAYTHRAPTGVRVPTRAGAHYLLYSFAPGYFVLNGFLQADIGLFDYAQATGSALARRLFADGDREARHEIPSFDTGAWSLYSLGGPESDLGYHKLARDFLRRLCKRTGAKAYCDAADRFTRYLHERPRLRVLKVSPLRAGRASVVRVALSKRSTVTLTAVRGGSVVDTASRILTRFGGSLVWIPGRAGDYELKLVAVDLLNHHTRVTVPVTVR